MRKNISCGYFAFDRTQMVEMVTWLTQCRETQHAEVTAWAQPALHFGVGNFHELSFDDVIVLIQPWYKFFENRHRYVLFATFPKMRTY